MLNDLPEELLAQVLLRLHPLDRLRSALVCRRWAEQVAHSELLKDVRLNVTGFEMETVGSILSKSHRRYRNLRLHKAELLDYDSKFWSTIGGNLRELELVQCQWSPKVLYRILQQCSRLQSLELGTSSGISIPDFEVPEEISREAIRKSLQNLQELHLDFPVSVQILEGLLDLMPNVTKLSLLRLHKKSDSVQNLSACLKSHRNITRVRSRLFPIEESQLMDLARICSGSLKTLSLNCRSLTDGGLAALSEFTELRHLSLVEPNHRLTGHRLERIFMNSPNLESLLIGGPFSISGCGLRGIFKLQKLQSLKIGGHPSTARLMSKDFMRELGSISTLRHLELRSCTIDSRLMQSLSCLKNLRKLVFDAAESSSDCLSIICENFEKLEELGLGSFDKLSDTDAMKLCRLKELRSLSFKQANGLTDRAFENGIGSPTMKSLSINNCSLTDVGLASIAAHHSSLRNLSISGCNEITVAGFVNFLQNESQLRELEVHHCRCLGDELLKALETLCPQIRSLTLGGATASNRARMRLKRKRNSITSIDFRAQRT